MPPRSFARCAASPSCPRRFGLRISWHGLSQPANHEVGHEIRLPAPRPRVRLRRVTVVPLQKQILRGVRLSPEAWLVVCSAAIAFSLKLWLDLTTFGSNDVYYWTVYSKYIYTKGSFTIYRDIDIYNHPPLISAWLWLMERINGPSHDRYFPQLVRAPVILADLGSTMLVWILAQTRFDRPRAVMVSCIFALSPILIMVSGFHGNTDPVFMFLILLALYGMIVKDSWLWAAITLGLAMNIKLVPIIMIPAFFFWIRPWRTRIRFLGTTLLMLVLGYGYHFAMMPHDMLRNVFLYSSLKHIWGIGRFWDDYDAIGKAVLFTTITGFSWFKGWQAAHASASDRGRHLLDAFSCTFLSFLVFTPGFGVQYLSWCVAPLAFVGPWASLGYSLLGGLFLFRVYTFWSRGFPWYYANSLALGQWVGVDRTLDRLLWEFLGIVLVGVTWRIGAEYLDSRAAAGRVA